VRVAAAAAITEQHTAPLRNFAAHCLACTDHGRFEIGRRGGEVNRDGAVSSREIRRNVNPVTAGRDST
jgi:hypothetical protein